VSFPGAAVREARAGEHGALLALRTAVFVHEQGVPPEEEVDDLDAAAHHLVALEAGAVVGTCRLLADDAAWTLGRMAVRRDRRRTGVGDALVRAAEDLARRRGARRMGLSAQMHAVGFYARHGYRSRGGVFLDAGIPHVRMERTLV
jgi:ElaA protein